MSHIHKPIDEKRRSLILAVAAATLLGKIGYASTDASSTPIKSAGFLVPSEKYALLIGNRDYPGGKDLPPAHKNVSDMEEALKYLEFEVTQYLDLHAGDMGAVLTKFSHDMRAIAETKMPHNMAVVFYFCGHGFQIKGENYLVPAGIDLSSEDAAKKSFKLMDDVINKIQPYALKPEGSGVTIALIDACRTDPNIKRGVDDLNQIIVPDGTIAFFASRSGRPALAPIDEKRNTFFTGSLVTALREADGLTPIDDLFDITASNCLKQVTQEFKKAGLNFPAQFPEKFSGKSRNKYVISNKIIALKNREKAEDRAERKKRLQELKDAAQKSAKDELEKEKLESENKKWDLMKETWGKIQQATRPKILVKLCDDFKKDYPGSEYLPQVNVIMDGAKRALDGYKTANLSADSLEDSAGNDDYHVDLINVLQKGDKDAAYRIALMYRDGANGLKRDERLTEHWLAFAAELGNGIASWQLSEIYGSTGQQAEQAKYEKLAMSLGYTPPPRLANRGY